MHRRKEFYAAKLESPSTLPGFHQKIDTGQKRNEREGIVK